MNKAKEVRTLRILGKTIDEICESVSLPRKEILRICRKAGMRVTEEETKVTKGRVAKSFAHSNEWVRDYISEKSSGCFEYESGYINMDSYVYAKCNGCGNVYRRSMRTFRTVKNVFCNNCEFEKRKKEREQQEENKKKIKQIQKDTAFMIKAGRGKQLSVSFCNCGNMIDSFMSNHAVRCKACTRRIENKNREIKRRTKIQSALVDRDITVDKLYKRDNGICYICNGVCDFNDKEERDGVIICGDLYPSIDHVKPLAAGGLHSWDNVKLAHRLCNSLKSDYYDEANMEKKNSKGDEECRYISAVI